MKNADSNIALMRGISVLALTLFASGCQQAMEASHAAIAGDIPLLVRFKDQCPKEVIEMVAACVAPDDPSKPNEVTTCRKRNEKIIWLAVTGAAPPYQPDANPPEFNIVFAGRNPAEKPGGGECKVSHKGVLDCKIKGDTPQRTYYDYEVVSVVPGACSLDPRIYVP